MSTPLGRRSFEVVADNEEEEAMLNGVPWSRRQFWENTRLKGPYDTCGFHKKYFPPARVGGWFVKNPLYRPSQETMDRMMRIYGKAPATPPVGEN